MTLSEALGQVALRHSEDSEFCLNNCFPVAKEIENIPGFLELLVAEMIRVDISSFVVWLVAFYHAGQIVERSKSESDKLEELFQRGGEGNVH